jgi:hypothetical protein
MESSRPPEPSIKTNSGAPGPFRPLALRLTHTAVVIGVRHDVPREMMCVCIILPPSLGSRVDAQCPSCWRDTSPSSAMQACRAAIIMASAARGRAIIVSSQFDTGTASMNPLIISKAEVQQVIVVSTKAFSGDGGSPHSVASLIDTIDTLSLQKQRELIALMEFGNAITFGEQPDSMEDLLASDSPIQRNPSAYLSTMTSLPACLENALIRLHETAVFRE